MTQDWGQVYWRWLTEAALPLWADAGTDRVRGGFHEGLDHQGNPLPVARRARVQGRQSFVFAHAGKLGWDGPWREIAPHGLGHLDRHYRRDDGLYATLADADGGVIDATAMTYDQAFVLLAAAALHEHRMGPGEDFALRLLASIEGARRHAGGGFAEADGRFLSNPHMHLFEAALAWAEAGRDPRWDALAAQMVALALKAFVDPATGGLREVFAADWSPAPGAEGDMAEPGHQFEWAWLLERWALRKGDDAAHRAALGLFASGTRGVDRVRNVALDETDLEGRPRRATARLWPQTERLKAALLLRQEDEAREAARGLWQYLETPVPGLWRDRMRQDGGFVEEPAPASSLYHIICAVAALKQHGTLT